jgi:general secretion pathway protein G
MFSKERKDRRRRSRAGFTLTELMIVIVIIGLLASVVTVSVRTYMTHSRQNIARSEMATICSGLEMYFTINGRYPTNDEGIELLTLKSDKAPDGILSKMPVDPWGNTYEYNYPGRSTPYEVICLGADRREGGTGGDLDLSSADVSTTAPK